MKRSPVFDFSLTPILTAFRRDESAQTCHLVFAQTRLHFALRLRFWDTDCTDNTEKKQEILKNSCQSVKSMSCVYPTPNPASEMYVILGEASLPGIVKGLGEFVGLIEDDQIDMSLLVKANLAGDMKSISDQAQHTKGGDQRGMFFQCVAYPNGNVVG